MKRAILLSVSVFILATLVSIFAYWLWPDTASYVVLRNESGELLEEVEVVLGDATYAVGKVNVSEFRKVIVTPTRASLAELSFRSSIGCQHRHDTPTYFTPGTTTQVEITIRSPSVVETVTKKHEIPLF